jgi:hypothetical protein
MKLLSFALSLSLTLIPVQSFAVTESPTPTPTVSDSLSPIPSPSASATPKASPTPTKKATKKPGPKKKPAAPSPAAKWPPKGFKVMDNIYWRTPSVETMMNVAAGDAALTRAIKACKEFSCGRIQVASIIGCVYWEIESKVITPNPDIPNSFLTMGMLRTLVKTSAAKEVATVVLRSGVAYSPTVAVVPTTVVCHQDQTSERVPSNTYIGR